VAAENILDGFYTRRGNSRVCCVSDRCIKNWAVKETRSTKYFLQEN